MGLFGTSFEEKVNAAIERIRTMGLAVDRLGASIDGKVVTLVGEVPDIETKTKVMTTFNDLVETDNTLNQIRIRKAPEAAEATPAAEATERWHVVQRGETLSGIAKQYYGKASRYMKIFEANRDVLDNPDLIKVGQKLRIPE